MKVILLPVIKFNLKKSKHLVIREGESIQSSNSDSDDKSKGGVNLNKKEQSA